MKSWCLLHDMTLVLVALLLEVYSYTCSNFQLVKQKRQVMTTIFDGGTVRGTLSCKVKLSNLTGGYVHNEHECLNKSRIVER